MKYSTKIYARALAGAILDKKADDKKIINNFLELLKKNQDTKRANEIIALAEGLLLKKTGNKKVVLETARGIDTKNLTQALIKKGDKIQEKINPALIAGVKIIVNNNQQLDFSLQRKLQEIF